MVLPPEIIAKLNECAQHDFIPLRDFWFEVLVGCTAGVGFGLALEVFELGHELLAIIRKRCIRFKYRILLSEKRLELYKMIAFAGWIFIVVGVLGEGYSEVRIHALNTSIDECSGARMIELQSEAGDAAESAKTAHKEAKEVSREATRLKKELAELATQLEAITPRSVILRNSKEDIRNAVSAFSGQMFITRICGSRGEDERWLEKVNTKDALVEVLTNNAPRWRYWGKGSGYWKDCSFRRQEGIVVFVNSDGPTKTIEAAKALCEELTSVLPPQSSDCLEEADTKSWSSDDDAFPGAQVAKNPDVIAVLVGAMPLAKGAKKDIRKQRNRP